MPFIKISQLTTATAVSATNQLEINQNGASRSAEVSVLATYVRSSATNVLVLPAGSTAAPALFPTGDTNTGIFFPAADTIAFSEGGVEVMRIDSDGDVGIGTTTPTARLNVVDATTQDAVRITQTGTGNALVVEDATNPDSSPFVVNADGLLITGAATNQAANFATGNARVQILGGTAPLALFRDADSSTAINLEFAKRRATGGLLASGDTIGRLYFSGNDGVAAIPAAFIDAAVDGTPGVNDMPGRLVFSTTADGAASPTERMRIDNEGRIGIGTTTLTAQRMRVFYDVSDVAASSVNILASGTHTLTADNALYYASLTGQASLNQGGFNATISLASGGSLQSYRTLTQVTGASGTVTAASGVLADVRNTGAGTLTNGVGFNAAPVQNTGGGTLTNAMGFYAATQTNGVNNYGFYSNTASGTGRWNFYANGTADNYFAGNVGIGITTPAARLNVVDTTSQDAVRITQTGSGNALVVEDAANPDATSFVIDNAGRVGIGVAPTTASGFVVDKIGSTSSPSAVLFPITIPQTATGTAILVDTIGATTEAAAFTLGTLMHYRARPAATFGAGSSVTNQYGFWADGALTGATNNFGFYSNIASGTNRWNFYANGTAANYFAGQVQLAAGSVSAPALAAFGDTNTGMFFPAADTIAFSEGGTEAMRINSSAQVEFSLGTVSLPSITATGDTNTGIFFPAADTLALGTNGTERLRIASAGQIGIGGANYGTSGQVLTSNGAAAAPSWQDATAGSAPQLREQLFLTSGTWTAPAGVTRARLVVIGGGGGGGGYNSGGGTNDGGDGGSAGVAVGNVTVVPGTTYTVTIGAGGAGGATNTNGTAGSTTSFGALMSATGGGAGLTNGSVGANGAGSSGTTRNTNTSVTTMAPFGGSNSRAAGSGAATVAWANNSANGAGAFGTGGNSTQAAAGAVNGLVYVEWVE